MTPQMRQFGRFLLFEKLGRSPHGTLWRGVRAWPDGVESVCVEQLDTTMTHHQGYIDRLVSCAQILVEQRGAAFCALDELGMVDRQYFMAGLLPEGQRLDHVLQRCEALGIPFPAGIAVTITVKRLQLAARQLNLELNEDCVVRSMDTTNTWLSYDGVLSLGWSAPSMLAADARHERAQWTTEVVSRVIQELGQALVSGGPGSHGGGIPKSLSEWLRDALSSGPATNEAEVTSLQTTLQSAWGKPLVDEQAVGTFLTEIFQREISVMRAQAQTESCQLSAIPENARARIANADAHNIVNRTRAPDIQQVIAVADSETSGPLYTGKIEHIDLPRLLYRYAVSKVSGRLYLQQRSNRYNIDWRNGRMVRVAASAPNDLLTFLDSRGILSQEDARKWNLDERSEEGRVIRLVVDHNRASHGELLTVLEAYARHTILTLFKLRTVQYAFADADTSTHFPFGPSELCMLLNEGVSAHAGAVQVEAFISAHHRHRIQKRDHAYIDIADLHLTTKQLRLWNAIQSDLTVAAQMTLWIAIPGINHDTASRLLVLLERLDLISLEPPGS